MRKGGIRKRGGQYFLRIYIGKKQRELVLRSIYESAHQENLSTALRIASGSGSESAARICWSRWRTFAEHWYPNVVRSRLWNQRIEQGNGN